MNTDKIYAEHIANEYAPKDYEMYVGNKKNLAVRLVKITF